MFTREEVEAIVAYLEYRLETDAATVDHLAIEPALVSFWRTRARAALAAQDLARYLVEEDELAQAIRAMQGEG